MLIRRQLLKAALHAATADDTRYFLDGVHIRPNGTIEATNGHVAYTLTDKCPQPDEDFPTVAGVPAVNGSNRPVLVESAIVTKLINGTAKKTTLPVLNTVRVVYDAAAQVTTLAATDLQVPVVVQLADSAQPTTFPDLAKVQPTFLKDDAETRQTVKIALGVELLQSLCRAAGEIHGKDKHKASCCLNCRRRSP